MTIATILMVDPSQPKEIQAWFDANPDVTTFKMYVNGNIVYLVY